MKKVTFLLATLLIGGMMFTGCKKDPQPTPTPTPSSKTAKVVYKVDNKMGFFVASDCFKYTLTYIGADGNAVTVNDVTLPWTSPEITVTKPFNAKIEGKATYDEATLPEMLTYGRVPSITADGNLVAIGNDIFQTVSKAQFLTLVAGDPAILNLSLSGTVE